ncbi:hypothetical protein ABZU25_08620 [Micromonospora sp. NPDC005215]|uniref:hypothetical protein n=1 Tax=Micromonospora sp. NPDC005215 TaxID=3157024 RepID=UPI00339EE017
MEFLWGVLSSLVASLIGVVAVWFGSQRVRGWLVAWLSRLTGVGVVRIYATQSLANAALENDLRQARWIRAFVSRGNELTRDSFSGLWAGGSKPVQVDLLIPDPEVADADSWLARRDLEVGEHDPGFGGGLLARQVRANIDYLRVRTAGRTEIQIRLYNLPHFGRIIATDNVVYLTVYQDTEHGRNSPCLVFRRSSPMYDLCLRLFALAWSDARSA